VKPPVLLIGASGVFGTRLARRLAVWPDIDLILAGRHEQTLRPQAEGLNARFVLLDRERPDPAALEVFAVIDCAGPFQDSGYGLVRAALAAGAHYIDIADGRDFVANFPHALDAEARAAGRTAITGASSTPAVSNAALDQITAGWSAIEAIRVAISPAGRTAQGLAVVRAILSWVGRPVRVFTNGEWQARPGWSGPKRLPMPGLGHRWASLAESPDLDVFVERFHPTREALFLAGLESTILHLGLWLAAWPVRLGLMRSLAPLSRPMKAMAGVIAAMGSEAGGMTVLAEGRTASGEPVIARWTLIADKLEGPHVPTLAASASLRALLDGRVAPGATVCAGLLSLDDVMRETPGLPITTSLDGRFPSEPGLFRRLLGPAFDALPAQVRRVHAGREAETFRGYAVARGSGGLATLARLVTGVKLGRFADFSVRIAPARTGEVWERRFGAGRFRSFITDDPHNLGRFTERLGPFTFQLEARPDAHGFDWLPRGWRLGPVPLPAFLSPKIRARSYAAGGVYRFTVLVAHPLAGVIVAYAGRLEHS